ncbi:MAG TPA: ribosome maturation factor RimM [Baekduia sp.]|nr:ribosome maturation factor RimM [Baekduia sp.]
MAELLIAGRIGRAHGLDGSFVVTRPRPRLLPLGGRVVVAGTPAEIIRRDGTDAKPLLRLDCLTTREAADAARGEELLVARTDAPVLETDEWLVEDLEGLRVLDGELVVGIVKSVIAYPSCDLLEVAKTAGGELLVPLVSDAVRSIDTATGVVDIDLAFLGENA